MILPVAMMRTEIKALHQRLKTTTIFVTHDQVEAMTMADKIVVRNSGRVEQIGAPPELYDRPANLFVAAFTGSPSMNLLTATVADAGHVTLGGVSLGAQTTDGLRNGQDIVYGIGPEDLELADEGIEASVVVVEPTGSELQVTLRMGEQDITAIFRDRHEFMPGQVIKLVPRRGRSHIFDRTSGVRL